MTPLKKPAHGGYPGTVITKRCRTCFGDGFVKIQSGPYMGRSAGKVPGISEKSALLISHPDNNPYPHFS